MKRTMGVDGKVDVIRCEKLATGALYQTRLFKVKNFIPVFCESVVSWTGVTEAYGSLQHLR